MNAWSFFKRLNLQPAGLFLLLWIMCACQSGRIACPENKVAKLKKSKGRSSLIFTARANDTPENNYGKPKTTRAVSNVSVEEWNCPQPGKKKYLPKSVKENIKKNLRKIKQQQTAITQ